MAQQPDRIDARIWFEAADAGDARVLSAMLDEGIDPFVERRGFTALHIVASGGHLESARLLTWSRRACLSMRASTSISGRMRPMLELPTRRGTAIRSCSR
jgi:hypothetical protein